MTSTESLLPWLFERRHSGIRWGLERTERLLAGVDDPHRRFRALHIGGTNGKGSVAALCEGALRAEGHRVGLYTSPHLIDFRERIRIGGHPVDAELLTTCAERLRPAIEASGASFFEAATVIAFLCFAEAEVEVAVVEVGLGGRLDATSVLRPAVTGVTNVALDHQEMLGPDLPSIALEKAGIFKAGVPALSAASDPRVNGVLARRAEAVGAPFFQLDDLATCMDVRIGCDGTGLRVRSRHWGERTLRTPLAGRHQARNALLAAEMLVLLPPSLRPSADALTAGFADARWAGRMQCLRLRGTRWIFDVAHNAAGVAALAEALRDLSPPRPRVVVAGIPADKAWGEMLPPLLSAVDAAILTVADSSPPARRWRPAEVAASLVDPRIRVIEPLSAALNRAATMAPHGTVIVMGSVHTVGDGLSSLGFQAV